jgi:hypothetical protein
VAEEGLMEDQKIRDGYNWGFIFSPTFSFDIGTGWGGEEEEERRSGDATLLERWKGIDELHELALGPQERSCRWHCIAGWNAG